MSIPSQIPTVQEFMTPTPHFIQSEDPIEWAIDLMKKHSIRHLPVVKAGSLQGILTQHDIQLALAICGKHSKKTKAGEVAIHDVYITHPETPLDQVVDQMAEKKIGSALIVQNHKLIGIFTSTDAMRILSKQLKNAIPSKNSSGRTGF